MNSSQFSDIFRHKKFEISCKIGKVMPKMVRTQCSALCRGSFQWGWSCHGDGLEALEWSHGHVGCDGRPQGDGGDGHGDGVGHGEGLEALEWSHGHVGGDGRPQGEGGDEVHAKP